MWQVKAFEQAEDITALNRRDARRVWVNEYNFIAPDDAEDVLYTPDANVCAGVAAVPDDPLARAGIMHLFSDARHYRFGEEAIRNHARKAWNTFSEQFNYGVNYSIVLFGGHRREENAPEISAESIADYFNAQAEYAAIVRSQEYKARDNQVSAAFIQIEKGNDRSKVPVMLDLMNQQKNMVRHLDDYFRHGGNDARLMAAEKSSSWLGDGLHDAIVTSGRARITHDFRYMAAPHDGIINMKEKQVVVLSSNDSGKPRFSRNNTAPPIKMFMGYEIYP